MNRSLKFSLPILLILGLVLTSACASAVPTPSAPSREEAPALTPAKPMPGPTPTPLTPPKLEATGDEKTGAGGTATLHMIVRTGNMSVVVGDVPAAMDQIAELADGFDGYVVSSKGWGEGERLAGSITIRVPAENFDDAMSKLRKLAVEVSSESTSSKDVTEEYVDLSAKLQNLEATEEQLLRIMEKAETVEDILQVQCELSKTRGLIEQVKGRVQYLERTSATSLIEVRLEQAGLEAKFTADKATVKAGEKVQFTSQIAGGFAPYSYEWGFGDGSTSTSKAPSHKYESAGSYSVSLKVTDDRGNTDTETRMEYITVLPGWSADSVASGAWHGLVAFGHGLAHMSIWIGIFSPVWLVIGGTVYWWRRRRRTKSGTS